MPPRFPSTWKAAKASKNASSARTTQLSHGSSTSGASSKATTSASSSGESPSKKPRITTYDSNGKLTVEVDMPPSDMPPLPPTPVQIASPTSIDTISAPPLESVNIQEDPTEDEFEKIIEEERTRRRKLLDQYHDKFEQTAHIVLDREYVEGTGDPCDCGAPERRRVVRCLDCDQFPVVCEDCWIKKHEHSPLHWGDKWDDAKGYFVRHDMSSLGGYILLGHCANGPCRQSPVADIILADVNGIHATKASYCECSETADKWRMLVQNGFMPATVSKPQTAFTFRLLRNWSLMNLQGKITHYHYMKALRRLTNNVFTGNVPDLYKQFHNVTHVWSLIQTHYRSGHMHNIDQFFPGRPSGSLVVQCPICPEDGINTESGDERTPPELSHLVQTRLTLDGNFQLNHFAKKSDQADVSLWGGRGYFEEAAVYNERCGLTEASSEEKSLCGHLRSLTKPERARFKNMDISGAGACQCDDVFIRSFGNFKLGERFICIDYVLSRGIESRTCDLDKQQYYVVSYDSMCAYCKKIVGRWGKMHPKYADLVRRMRWTIPVCHCRNHVDSCEPLYLYTFKEGVGRFPGESAEQTWARLNGIGAAVRQMNLGPREDTINLHSGDWNYLKMVGAAYQLFLDMIDAKRVYVTKRDHFVGLTVLHADHAEKWNAMDRSPVVDPKNKRRVTSVYSHNDDKVPSLQSLVQHMRDSEELVPTGNGNRKSGKVANFLNEGIYLLIQQHHIRALARKSKNEGSQELIQRRIKFTKRLKDFRKLSKDLLSEEAADYIQKKAAVDPELEVLGLPSDFTLEERNKLNLTSLSMKAAQLLEGKMVEVVRQIQTSSKAYTAGRDRKRRDDRGQTANTRSNVQLRALRAKRDERIRDYNLLRTHLESLGQGGDHWPVLTEKDTHRFSTEQRRVPGTSHIPEGRVAIMNVGPDVRRSNQPVPGSIQGDRSIHELVLETNLHDVPEAECSPEESASYFTGTKMSHRKPQQKRKREEPVEPEKAGEDVEEETEDAVEEETAGEGWIWKPERMKKLSKAEFTEWLQSIDQVQYHRAEAEFERAGEEIEIKHAKFHRCVRYFTYMRDCWRKLAEQWMEKKKLGFVAYAKEQADTYDTLRWDCKRKFQECGIPILREIPQGKILADQVALFREQEAEYFSFDREKGRPAFMDPTVHSFGFKDVREGTE